MKIDRRITNGLAWAGAVLVVVIPVADFALRQAMPEPAPQVSVVREEPAEPVALPTAAAERPEPASEPEQTTVAEAETPARPAAAQPSTSSDPVDNFVQSGRELPSYIGGGSSQPAAPAATRPAIATPQPAKPATPAPAPAAPATAAPAAPAVTTPAPVTAQQPAKVVPLPTPVSQRPPSVAPRGPVTAAPSTAPLIIDRAPPVVAETPPVFSAEDLDDWETGPLSDFLAGRAGQRQAEPVPVPDYDSDGFFLDEGPNNQRQAPFPRAYGEGFYYPFAD